MQLKFTRHLGSKGVVFKDKTYRLNAMIAATPEETSLLEKYGYWRGMTNHYASPAQADSDPLLGISFSALIRGAVIESQDMNDIFRSELRLIEACKNILASAKAQDTFNGTERVIELDDREHELVAKA